MKVIQEAVSPEVSKLNHAVKQKARRSNAVFSSRRKTRKKNMNSSNPSYQSMVCVIELGVRFINSIIFFICLEIFIVQEKKQLR